MGRKKIQAPQLHPSGVHKSTTLVARFKKPPTWAKIKETLPAYEAKSLNTNLVLLSKPALSEHKKTAPVLDLTVRPKKESPPPCYNSKTDETLSLEASIEAGVTVALEEQHTTDARVAAWEQEGPSAELEAKAAIAQEGQREIDAQVTEWEWEGYHAAFWAEEDGDRKWSYMCMMLQMEIDHMDAAAAIVGQY